MCGLHLVTYCLNWAVLLHLHFYVAHVETIS